MYMRSRGRQKRCLAVAICLLLLSVALATALPDHGVLAAVGQDSVWSGNWEIIGSLEQGFFISASGIAVDNSNKDTHGTIYVADPGNNCLRSRAGGATNWTFPPNQPFAYYDQPWDVAVDKNGDVYVVNTGGASQERVVWKYVPSTGQWTDLTYGYTFLMAQGIAVDNSGNVYVANTSMLEFWQLGKVVRLAPGSTSWEAISDPNDSPLFIALPRGITVDGSGNVYVTANTNSSDSRLLKYTPGTSSWEGIGGGESGLVFNSVAADPFGNVYVAVTSSREGVNSHIYMFENGGVANRARIFRTPGDFKDLRGIAADDQGCIYMTDRTDNGSVISTHQGWATGLAWSTQPGNGTPGQSLAQQPVVRLVGAGGQTMTNVSNITVTATLNSSNGAILSSDTATLVKGVATFSNLRVDRPGTYSLKAECNITNYPVNVIINNWIYFDLSTLIVSGDSAEFTVTDPPAAAPSASPASGARVARGWTITLAGATPGATIRYTTDGSNPGPASPGGASGTGVTVTGALGGTFTIKAYASAVGWSDSPISTFTYSIYSADSYTVTFMDGGAVYTTRTVPAGTSLGSADWPIPAKAGYNDGSWYTAPAGGTEFTAGTIVEADTTVYARYVPITYNLSYQLNGGSATNPITYTVESAAITLNNPTRAHYNFAGWSGPDIEGDPLLTVTIPQGSLGHRSYTAHWEPVTYSISYDLAGGAVDPANPESYTVETASFTLRNPIRPGYTFDGWTGTGIVGAPPQSVTIAQGSSGDRSYTAHWTAINYSITYDLDGGSATNPITYTVENAAITLNNPIRMHYSFTGWSGPDIEGDPLLTVTIPQGSLGDRSYTAHWEPVSYSISYILAGGAVDPANPESYTLETVNFTLQNPSRPGYTFAGWSGTGIPGGEPSSSVTIARGSSGDRSYTAHWTAINYSITCNLAGGSAANPITYTVESADITLSNPTREHYEFTGWSGTDIEGDPLLSVTIPQGSLGDRSYTAHWEPVSYSISYNLAGGAVDPANPAGYTIEIPGFTLQNPTRPHYTFTGWTGTELMEETLTVTVEAGATGERQYTANWAPVSYSITYELAGGAAANPEDYTVESEDITLDLPVREHYHFAGWSGTDITGDPMMTVTIAQGSAGDREYSAHWVTVSYAIVYDLAGGTASNPESYTVESDALTLQNPTRIGYIFTGWTGTELADKTLAVTIAAGSTGERRYAANWIPVVFSGLPDSYTMSQGESITWDARPEGGDWDWDKAYFSAAFNSPATFKALKAGTSTITYTVEGAEHRITVTINNKSLPGTGQNRTWIWALLAAAALLAAGIWAKFSAPIKGRST